jgi:hypothetical protein
MLSKLYGNISSFREALHELVFLLLGVRSYIPYTSQDKNVQMLPQHPNKYLTHTVIYLDKKLKYYYVVH